MISGSVAHKFTFTDLFAGIGGMRRAFDSSESERHVYK